MKAVSRFGYVMLAGVLALAPVAALAQQASPSTSTSTTNTPAPDSVGPQELQNFSLSGTVTRPADQPATTQPAPQKRQPQSAPKSTPAASSPAPQSPATAPVAQARPVTRRTPAASQDAGRATNVQAAPQALSPSSPSSSTTVALPKIEGGSEPAMASQAQQPAPAPAFAPAPEAPGSLAPDHRFPILPWLLAALFLGAGGAFLFWRNRSRAEFAGDGPQISAFTAPAPAPLPRQPPQPAPAPSKAPPPAPVGIVSTRLRPWVDIAFRPLRCVLEDELLSVEFELELFNSGSAPARAVLAEATVLNAGPAQDGEIANFFGNPVGKGERIAVIPPLKRVAIRTKVVAPRAQVQSYELGGRQVFVPVIAFNALYSWSGGEGQTSVSYLLGGNTNGEKMSPFRLDLGPRIFRGVAGRLLPTGVRR